MTEFWYLRQLEIQLELVKWYNFHIFGFNWFF